MDSSLCVFTLSGYKDNENWQKIMLIIGTVALGLFIVNGTNLGIVKPLIARARPLNSPDLQGIVVSVNHYVADGYSFFSSHTANAFVLAVFFSLLVRDRIFSILMIAWSIMVSLTRPYLGVHYPSDVFVGMIFGSSVAVFIYFLYLAFIFVLVTNYTIFRQNIREQVIASQI